MINSTDNTQEKTIAAPKVSVILPSLNVQPYIEECIRSITQQTLSDIEILCIDAGSTDGTEEIIRSFAEKDSRVKLIHSDQKSYGYQMNLGLSLAKGEYIGIVETDDFAEKNMFQMLYDNAKKRDVDVVKANYFLQKKDDSIHFELLAGLPYDKVICPKDYISLCARASSIWSCIYKKELLDRNEIRFLETPGASYQDTSFILKVWICAERVLLLKQGFLHYRLDNPNSSVRSAGKIFYVRDEMNEVRRFLELFPDKKKYFEKIIWDKEARSYKWNFSRLSDELKYDFLSGVQKQFQEGLKRNMYLREYLNWSVWKMILETAEDPLIYLEKNCNSNVYAALLKDPAISLPDANRRKHWRVKERMMALPQTFLDIVYYIKYFNLRYCISGILGKHQY